MRIVLGDLLLEALKSGLAAWVLGRGDVKQETKTCLLPGLWLTSLRAWVGKEEDSLLWCPVPKTSREVTVGCLKLLRPLLSHELLRVNEALTKGVAGAGLLELDSHLNPFFFPHLAGVRGNLSTCFQKGRMVRNNSCTYLLRHGICLLVTEIRNNTNVSSTGMCLLLVFGDRGLGLI